MKLAGREAFSLSVKKNEHMVVKEFVLASMQLMAGYYFVSDNTLKRRGFNL